MCFTLCYTFGTRAGRASPEHISSVDSNPVFEAVRASYACDTAFLQISTGDENAGYSIAHARQNASPSLKNCIFHNGTTGSLPVHEIFAEKFLQKITAVPPGLGNAAVLAEGKGFEPL